jgi:hypothetical protein
MSSPTKYCIFVLLSHPALAGLATGAAPLGGNRNHLIYSITKVQDAIRSLFKVTRDLSGNLPPMPGVFPDYPARIIRIADGCRELTMARLGDAVASVRTRGKDEVAN